jgi:ATP-binding cassette subfamily F protein 3
MERIVLPPEKARFNYFAFHPPGECAERVVEIEDAAAAFGEHTIFSHLSMLVRRGDGVAVVGANGEGKTTLLRMIVGELEPAAGSVKLGSRVKVGYFSQQHEGLHKERTVLEEILYEFGTDEETARGYLGAFLFRGDEVERVIGDLSGGEQSRLAFLKLMLTGANFLVLDEPTNHLDIPAKEAVEEALMAFPGTFLVVSHDRYFLNKVANVTMEMADGKLTRYDGGYDYYKEKKSAEEALKAVETPAQAAKETKREQQAPKKETTAEKEKRIAPPSGVSEEKRQELLQRAEAELAMAEAELKMLEHEMNDPELQQDPEKSRKIAEEYAEKEKEIERRYEKWGALAEG